MVPALCISIFGGEWQSAVAFLKTMGLIFVLAHGLIFFGRKSKKNFFAKEGLACVGLPFRYESSFSGSPSDTPRVEFRYIF